MKAFLFVAACVAAFSLSLAGLCKLADASQGARALYRVETLPLAFPVPLCGIGKGVAS